MSVIGNILWVTLGGGILFALGYLLSGLILFCGIITIPFGVQMCKLAALALLPFGREVTSTRSATGCVATVMNILWMFTFGLILALLHLAWAILCAITIVGLPFAKQHMKLCAIAFTPFGRQIGEGGQSVEVNVQVRVPR